MRIDDMPSVDDIPDEWELPDSELEWNEFWRSHTFSSRTDWRNAVNTHGRKGLLLMVVGIEPTIWDSAA